MWPSLSRLLPLLALLAAGHPAMAQDPPVAPPPSAKPDPAASTEPSVTTATYGDWLLRCTPKPNSEAGDRICEVSQGIQLENRGLIAQVVFGRVAKDDPLRMVVQLPLGTWLPPGAELFLDDKGERGLPAPFTICLQSCFANVEVPVDFQADLEKASGQGRLAYVDNTRKQIVLPVSFQGLKAALDADKAR